MAPYTVDDRSICVPVLKKYVWSPLLSVIPEGFSANNLTLLGTAASATAFVIAVFAPPSRLAALLIAALVFAYLTLDNIDGAQARRSGTSSPLGEFLDHWLDTLNLSFLFMGAIQFFQIQADRAVLILVLATLSYSMTIWEQKRTGRIFMSWFGNVEGILVIALFYVTAAIIGPLKLIGFSVWAGHTVIDVLFYAAVITTSLTTLSPMLRVKTRLLEPVVWFAPIVLFGIWYSVGNVPASIACFVLMLMAPAFAGRVLIGHVFGDEVRLNPLLSIAIVVAATCSVLFQLPPSIQALLAQLILFYALALVGFDFVRTTRKLQDHLLPGEFLSIAFRRPR